MKEIKIFECNYRCVDIFSPWSIEFITDLLYGIGYTSKNLDLPEARGQGLSVIKQLLELDIIYVYRWMGRHSFMNDKDLSVQEIMNYIEKIWFIGANHIDFIDMVMFGSTDWYLKALEKLGMTHTTYWKTFVKEEIGDLEKWIEENRPIKTPPVLKENEFEIFKIGYSYINLFYPYKLKSLEDIITDLDYDYLDIKKLELIKTKSEILNTITQLIEFRLLNPYIFDTNWWKNHKNYNTINDLRTYLDTNWSKLIKKSSNIEFKFQNWYVTAIEKQGMASGEDWELFVENKLGNLEKWIEENKPKD